MPNIYEGICYPSIRENNRFWICSRLTSCPAQYFNTVTGTNPYTMAGDQNYLYLLPAVVGITAGLSVSFRFFGYSLTSGYNKFMFFLIIYAIITALAMGRHILQVLRHRDGINRFFAIMPGLILMVSFFALSFSTAYSLYPCTFSGTIGDTPLTQLFSFLSFSIGSITVGESYNVIPEKPEVQLLASIESIWNLFVLSLLISLYLPRTSASSGDTDYLPYLQIVRVNPRVQSHQYS